MTLKHADQSAITVVSTYSENVLDLKTKLAAANFADIEIATVDSFQGRENRIVILHLAAAFVPYVNTTTKYERLNPVGFTGDMRRLNVALSRAQDYSFVFGWYDLWESRILPVQKLDRKEYPNATAIDAEPGMWPMLEGAPLNILMAHVSQNGQLVWIDEAEFQDFVIQQSPGEVNEDPEVDEDMDMAYLFRIEVDIFA